MKPFMLNLKFSTAAYMVVVRPAKLFDAARLGGLASSGLAVASSAVGTQSMPPGVSHG